MDNVKEIDAIAAIGKQNKELERQLLELASANKILKQSERNLRDVNTKLAHKIIKRTTQYAFISQINQSIVHTNDQATLFSKACTIAHEVGKFKIAWIGLFDTDKKEISIVENCGLSDSDIGFFQNTSYQNHGAQGQVLYTGAHLLCNNILHHPDLEKWRAFATKYSIRSFMILPIKRLGNVIGTINLYSTECDFFEQEEIALLTEVVGDISFALDIFEKEKKHRETENLIVKNEKRYRALVENGADAVTILSAEGKVIYISPSVESILGYTEAEAMQFDLFTLIHPDDVPNMAKVWETVLKTKGIPIAGHTGRMRHKDGSWRWLAATVTNMLHAPEINGIIDNFRDITPTMELERLREFDKNNLDALINTSDDLMWSVDRDLKLITYNRAFSNIVRFLFDKDIKVGDSVLWPELSMEQNIRFKALYNRTFAGEAFIEIEYTPPPFEIWSEISYYPIMMGKEVIGSACYSRDITSLKKAEMSLKKSEAFNRGVLNSLNSHIAVLDKTGTIVAVNEAWKRFAFSNSGTTSIMAGIGVNYFEECERAGKAGVAIADDALSGMIEVIEEKRTDLYLEYDCHSPTEKRWFGMRVMKFDSDEQLIVVSHNDISERKKAEQNLLENQNRLKEAQTLAHMGSWQLDFKTKTLQLSDESCRILGSCNIDNQLTFAEWSKLIHVEDRPFVMQTIKDSRESLDDLSYQYRIERHDGTTRHIYSESKYVFDSNNKAIGIHGIMQDITVRKIAEEEREKINADILLRNKDLEQFSYIVSHNLRAPVANIIGLSDVVMDENLDPEVKNEVMEGISDSVKKLDEVITDLNFILQTKQHINQENETVVFSTLVDDIKTSIDKLIEDENAMLLIDFDEVPKMITVKTYLHSIFYNLIINSLKYRSPNVNPIISIISRKNKNKLLLVFSDNGIGIDLENKGEQVFGMYKRFHPQISEGKGMGLYMVKTQVESIGGKIYIESEVNKGTTFTIEFENYE